MTTTTGCETAIRILAAAFAQDPLMDWLLPGRAPGSAVRLFRPLVEASAAHGELALGADGAAVAVWLPRAAEQPVTHEQLPDELARLRTFLALTQERHPVGQAHLYLAFLGVVPGAQGRGLGGALLRERLAKADADGVPAYLEASSERSRPLYERHGFRAEGDPIALPGGPRLWPMWRSARP